MEVILNELRRNDVDVDILTLSYHIKHILKEHAVVAYIEMRNRVNHNDMREIFDMMNVNNFGRAMAYLTLTIITTSFNI